MIPEDTSEVKNQKKIHFEELLNEIDQLNFLIDIEKEALTLNEQNQT